MIFYHLWPDTHVPADSSNLFVLLHVIDHLHECCTFRDQSNIEDDRILSRQFSTESVEEPIMRGKFASIRIFGDHKQVHEDFVVSSPFEILFTLIVIKLIILFLNKSIFFHINFNSERVDNCHRFSSFEVNFAIFFCIY